MKTLIRGLWLLLFSLSAASAASVAESGWLQQPKSTHAQIQFLVRYGASGIPFNAVFGPAMPNGTVLSSLLSKDDLLGSLNRAGTAVSPDTDKVEK